MLADRRSWTALVLALALAACATGPGPTAAPRKPDATRGKGGTGAAGAAGATTPALPPAGGPAGGSLISDHGAALTGLVRAPARLISDKGLGVVANNGAGVVANNGAGVVANNGGAVVSNNGSTMVTLGGAAPRGSDGGILMAADAEPRGFRLAEAAAQQPVGGVRVTLHDAAGQAVTGPDGRPLVAVTDAAGRYAFDAALPARTLVLGVALPGERGQLQALAIAAGDAPRRVDVDFVSTLTTTYILENYVRPQAEPLATLAKLPAAVEAETRAAADAALQAGTVAVPERLDGAGAIAAVAALRAEAPAFDAKMEEVKRLLLAAGLSDLGAGRSALEVDLGQVSAIALAADGALMVASHYTEASNRVWRLRPDGTLEAVAGGATASKDDFSGRLATEAGLYRIKGLVPGPAGRLLLFEDRDRLPFPEFDVGAGITGLALGVPGLSSVRRLSWLGPDGRLATLAGAPTNPVHAFLDGDALVALTASGRHVRVGPDGRLQDVFKHPFDALTRITGSPWSGRDAAGRLYLGNGSLAVGAAAVLRCEAAGGPFSPVLGAGAPAAADGPKPGERLLVDPAGNTFAWAPADGRLTLYPPAGPPRVLAQGLDKAFAPTSLMLGAEDVAYFVNEQASVYRIAAGQASRVAGAPRPGGAAGGAGNATGTELGKPRSLAIGPTGSLYVADQELGQALRFGRTGAGFGPPEVFLEGGDAATGPDWARIRVDGQERVVVTTRDGGLAIRGADGPLTVLRPPRPGATISGLAVAPTGVAYVVEEREGPLPTPAPTPTAPLATPAPGTPTPRPTATPKAKDVYELVAVTAAGARTLTVPDATPEAFLLVTCAPDGRLHVVSPGNGGQLRWWQGDDQAGLVAGPGLTLPPLKGLLPPPLTAIAVDPAGRLYVAQSVVPGMLQDLFGGLPGMPGIPMPGASQAPPDGRRVVRFDATGGAATVIAGQGGLAFSGTGVDDGLDTPQDLAFDADGDLLIVDAGHRQIKRVPAAQLR